MRIILALLFLGNFISPPNFCQRQIYAFRDPLTSLSLSEKAWSSKIQGNQPDLVPTELGIKLRMPKGTQIPDNLDAAVYLQSTCTIKDVDFEADVKYDATSWYSDNVARVGFMMEDFGFYMTSSDNSHERIVFSNWKDFTSVSVEALHGRIKLVRVQDEIKGYFFDEGKQIWQLVGSKRGVRDTGDLKFGLWTRRSPLLDLEVLVHDFCLKVASSEGLTLLYTPWLILA
jgi:hypothetical protein